MSVSSSFANNLNIGMWNIQGLTPDKIIDHNFVNFLSKNVISLVET